MNWVCPLCSTSNDASWELCIVCDTPKPAEPEKKPDAAADEYTPPMYLDAMDALNRGAFGVAAQKFMLTAEMLDHAPSQNEYGNCLFQGKGVPKAVAP